MQMIFPIAFGGACGALARYSVMLLTTRFAPNAVFPFATLVVNLLGCFLIGALHAYATNANTLSPAWRAGLMTGFLGAFTTYSTFANESVLLFDAGKRLYAGLDIAAHVLGGIACVAMGHAVFARGAAL